MTMMTLFENTSYRAKSTSCLMRTNLQSDSNICSTASRTQDRVGHSTVS